MNMSSISPKCLNNKRTRALTADGYVLPCCWVDTEDSRVDPTYKHLFDDSLHINIIEDIESIESSTQWQHFFIKLEHNRPELNVCHMMCGNNERNPIRDRILV